MLKIAFTVFCFVLFLNAEGEEPQIPKKLKTLTKKECPEISHIEIKGDNPEIVYIPIVHDNPEFIKASGKTRKSIQETLVRSRKISEHLYENYGIKNVLLEGLSKSLSDKYNSPKYAGRKLSVGKSKSLIFKVWFDLLNNNRWKLVPAYEKQTHGALTKLGHEYNTRIMKALDHAQKKGWFSTQKAFKENMETFTKHVTEACRGYNEKKDAILSDDPGLKKEYDITVIQRNKVFIDNTLKTGKPGIIMCGGGHVQDLIDQLKKGKRSYMIIVPKGIDWPPPEKDDEKIYSDMLKLGCQLRQCDLKFGDGGSAKIKLPIK